jgi:uncharacterized protein (TIGR03435 family)
MAATDAVIWVIPRESMHRLALAQQLGLKLEPRREPRDVIVIDSAEMPVLD